jgi:hypothetical protein
MEVYDWEDFDEYVAGGYYDIVCHHFMLFVQYISCVQFD